MLEKLLLNSKEKDRSIFKKVGDQITTDKKELERNFNRLEK